MIAIMAVQSDKRGLKMNNLLYAGLVGALVLFVTYEAGRATLVIKKLHNRMPSWEDRRRHPR